MIYQWFDKGRPISCPWLEQRLADGSTFKIWYWL